MKTKDHAISATDKLTDALRGLVRIDYANPKQAARNLTAIAFRLDEAKDAVIAALALEEARILSGID